MKLTLRSGVTGNISTIDYPTPLEAIEGCKGIIRHLGTIREVGLTSKNLGVDKVLQVLTVQATQDEIELFVLAAESHNPGLTGLYYKSGGGESPVSRLCYKAQHMRCQGSWTQYPDESGPCECTCHKRPIPVTEIAPFNALDVAQYHGEPVTVLGVGRNDDGVWETEIRKGNPRPDPQGEYIGWVPATDLSARVERTFTYLVSEDRGKTFRVVATGLNFDDILVIHHRAKGNGRVEGKHYRFTDHDGKPVLVIPDQNRNRLDT